MVCLQMATVAHREAATVVVAGVVLLESALPSRTAPLPVGTVGWLWQFELRGATELGLLVI